MALGVDREWLLQPEAAEAGVGDQFPSLGGMLCLPGGNSGGAVPGKDTPFMAYLRTITRASRNFDGTAWASYDMAYRRQAANQRSLDWGIIDSALYNEAFMGQARLISRYRFCLADSHNSRECSFGLEERSPPARAPYTSTHRDQKSVQICQLFNKPGGNACRYKHCHYAHLCSKCRRGPHPAAECSARYGRSPSPKESRP